MVGVSVVVVWIGSGGGGFRLAGCRTTAFSSGVESMVLREFCRCGVTSLPAEIDDAQPIRTVLRKNEGRVFVSLVFFFDVNARIFSPQFLCVSNYTFTKLSDVQQNQHVFFFLKHRVGLRLTVSDRYNTRCWWKKVSGDSRQTFPCH